MMINHSYYRILRRPPFLTNQMAVKQSINLKSTEPTVDSTGFFTIDCIHFTTIVWWYYHTKCMRSCRTLEGLFNTKRAGEKVLLNNPSNLLIHI